MPQGADVVIKVAGVDITSDVIFATASFESQLNAVPGAFEFTVKDEAHTHSFVTGSRVECLIDGVPYYGGFLRQIGREYPFDAMDTADPESVPRYFNLKGLDYNLLFDWRVLRRSTDSLNLKLFPNFSSSSMDGTLIKYMCDHWLDLPSWLDYETYVDDVMPPYNVEDLAKPGAWEAPGTKWRKQMEVFASFGGQLFYIDAAGFLHWHALEGTVQRWGFSDAPVGGTLTVSPAAFQGVTIGPRSVSGTEDGSGMTNDALVWGGSQWAGSGGTVFAREQNTDSITDHGRWQVAETHFGEQGFGIQAGVDARADLIVNGPPDATYRGRRFPQWNFKLGWFAHHVPMLSGARDHLRAGYLAHIDLDVHELTKTLPLRQVRLSFPSLDPDGDGYVRFDGTFGTQPDDPFSLWRFLLRNQRRPFQRVTQTADDTSDTTLYNAIGHFVPTPDPDGVEDTFTVKFGYVDGSTAVYVDGERMLMGTDYIELDNVAGTIQFQAGHIPTTGQEIFVTTRTLAT